MAKRNHLLESEEKKVKGEGTDVIYELMHPSLVYFRIRKSRNMQKKNVYF